jgi:hypothetical protein
MNYFSAILEQLRKTRTIALIIILIGFIAYIYQSAVTEVVTYKIKQPKPKDEIQTDIRNNVMIQQMLNDLMLSYQADRAYIFQFHNTIKYYDGTHRNHQSMTFEVCAKGISSEAYWLQNLPVSIYPMVLQKIMLERMNYSDINDIEEHTTKLQLQRQGIKSVVIAPYFKDGNFVAYIGLDFVKCKNDSLIDYNKFKSFTNQIGNILIQ